jgi:para-aminobenzoate synthetase/4-amino-4-deoxychorismate lyase
MAGAASTPLTAARPVRIALPRGRPAGDAPLLVHDDEHPFALTGRWAGGGALAGSRPLRVAAGHEDPFALLDALPAVEHPVPGGFVGGGWFGYLGYRLGQQLEHLGAPPPAPHTLPPFALAFYDHVLRCDSAGDWWFEALWTDERAPALEERIEALRARLAGGDVRVWSDVRTGPWRTTPTPAGHAVAVQACRERIAAGDLFQANLALRLDAELRGDPVALFVAGTNALAPDRAAFLRGPWGAIASLSPELFLERHDDLVRSAPIKGTRPANADPAALAASEKDRAENVMIVDLVRNDLGRVCAPGSVSVTALAEARPHAGVWHLVSEVAGTLREGVGNGELLRATFPPGSVTGAPKVAAMDVISALESAERQAFCGAIGFASPTAGLELSVAIRSFECVAGRVWLDVGGGVVADSDPDGEAAEALAKAAPLLAAIGAPPVQPRPGGSSPAPRRLHPRPVPRPDPAAGVFETVLVRDGVPLALDAHLRRLDASTAALGLPGPSTALISEAHALAAEHGSCRLRLVADATGARAEAAPLPVPTRPTWLRSVTVPGGLGAHKWRDRRLLDALAAEVVPAVPLLVDLDGHVLEASRANVIVVWADGRTATPPLDGRVLPGVTRARVLHELQVDERPITLDELAGASAVVLTGALRGVEPVAGVDDAALAAPPRALLSCLAAAPARRPAAADTT